MILELILSALAGVLGGFLIGFFYKKIQEKRINSPKHIQERLEKLDKDFDVMIDGKKVNLLEGIKVGDTNIIEDGNKKD